MGRKLEEKFDTEKMMRYDDFTDEDVGNIVMDSEPLEGVSLEGLQMSGDNFSLTIFKLKKTSKTHWNIGVLAISTSIRILSLLIYISQSDNSVALCYYDYLLHT